MSTDSPTQTNASSGNPFYSEPIWRMIIRWLLGKDSATVLLSLQLAAICWVGWWGIREGVPAHIASIHAGYREHVAELKQIAEKFEADQQRDAKAHADAMEIIRDIRRMGIGQVNPANVAGNHGGS